MKIYTKSKHFTENFYVRPPNAKNKFDAEI